MGHLIHTELKIGDKVRDLNDDGYPRVWTITKIEKDSEIPNWPKTSDGYRYWLNNIYPKDIKQLEK